MGCVSSALLPYSDSADSRSSSAPSSTASSTSLSSSTTTHAPLIPDYTFLAHCIHHNLSRASISSPSSTSTTLPVPLGVAAIIASFLWTPLRTNNANDRHYDNSLRCWLNTPHCIGRVHGDTRQHDDWSGHLRSFVLSGWRLRALHGWGWSGRCANGLGLTYCHPTNRSSTIDIATRLGTNESWQRVHQHKPQLSRFELQAGERIVQVAITWRVSVDAIRFETSHGRRCQLGSSVYGGSWVRLLPTAEVLKGRQQVEVLAFMFGVGARIHNVGVYYQLVAPQRSERECSSSEVLAASLRRMARGQLAATTAWVRDTGSSNFQLRSVG